MATVYLARNDAAAGGGRHVALKLVRSAAPGFQELASHLLREARIVARIRHPNVVQVLDAGELPEGIFLVMEYVEGGTLAALSQHALAQGGPLPLPIAARILSDALLGLDVAHDVTGDDGQPLKLVHRDFSPQNILLGLDGEVKLGDFGVAKVEHTSHRTRTGIVKGTVSYMSPEQVRGQALDRRSDLWSAGVVAWEAFTGQRLHGKQEAIAAAMSTLTGRLRRMRSVRPELPEALDDVIAQALTRDPKRRPSSAGELRQRLLEALPGNVASGAELSAYTKLAFATELVARRAELERLLSVKRSPSVPPPALTAPAAASSEAEAPERAGFGVAANRVKWVMGGVLLGALLLWMALSPPRSSGPSSPSAKASVEASPPRRDAPAGLASTGSSPVAPSTESLPTAAPAASGIARPLATATIESRPARRSSGSATPRGSRPTSAAPPLAENPYSRSPSDSR